jgi:hypothetical protein
MQGVECQQHLHPAEHKDRTITITGRGGIHNKQGPHRGVHHLTPGITLQIDPVQILSIGMNQTRPIARREVAIRTMVAERPVRVRRQVQAQTVERGVEIN